MMFNASTEQVCRFSDSEKIPRVMVLNIEQLLSTNREGKILGGEKGYSGEAAKCFSKTTFIHLPRSDLQSHAWLTKI